MKTTLWTITLGALAIALVCANAGPVDDIVIDGSLGNPFASTPRPTPSPEGTPESKTITQIATPTPEPTRDTVPALENGCMVYAYDFEIKAARILQDDNIWAHLIAFKWTEDKTQKAHAMCIYALKNGDLWVYDHTRGSFKLGTQDRTTEGIRTALSKWVPTVTEVNFIDLSEATAAATPPPPPRTATLTTISELGAMYDNALRAYNANNFPEALKQLDAIDARQPVAQSQNLRGVIMMRQSIYDKAEAALNEALRIDPKLRPARYNLAEIAFRERDWAQARERFQGLLSGDAASELQGEAAQLLQYKILLTYLFENKESMVDSLLAKLALSPDTPAAYYANVAIALQQNKPEKAKEWMAQAEKNFSPRLNGLFAQSLYELGLLLRQAGALAPSEDNKERGGLAIWPTAADFAKYAMKLREQARLTVPPSATPTPNK
jgi:hypothetical protein